MIKIGIDFSRDNIRSQLYNSFVEAFHRPVIKKRSNILIKQDLTMQSDNSIKQTTENQDLHEAIRDKNTLLVQQSKRIKLLEDKMTLLRRRYFYLKYINVILP